jgi:hypothetical protein
MNPWRAWNTFWFCPISARPLGAFRIVFGLTVLANLAVAAADLDHWYTGVGLLQGTEAREVAGPLRPSVLHWVQDPGSVRLWFAATAWAAVGLTVGWHTRIMAVLFYLGMLSIHHRNIVTNSGADALLMILTFYVMLSPCGTAYSLDSRRAAWKRGTLAEPLIVPWAQRLIQVQIGLIYFNTAVFKSRGSSWLDGTALHYVLYNKEIGWLRLEFLTQYPLAVNVLTHAALVIEFALAFLLWFRATRPWVIVAGLSLHAGIHLMVNIPIFGELMVACYLLFLAPDELDVLLRRLDPRRWFGRSRASAPAPVIPGRVDRPEPTPWQGPHEPEHSFAESEKRE